MRDIDKALGGPSLRRPLFMRSKRGVTLWSMVVSAAFLIVATSASAWLSSGVSVNYPHPAAPVYTGHFAPDETPADGRLIAATYNLQYGEDVSDAVTEFRSHPKLAAADVVLLQEMDQDSTATFAKALGYDFVYYPASIHPHTKRNMGNAVLSRAPLHDPGKTLLPHTSPFNGQRRIAVRALAQVEGVTITAFSVHLETQLLGIAERRDQLRALMKDVPEDTPIVVGGDFNTSPGADLSNLTGPLTSAGFSRTSEGSGDTWSFGPLDAALDHVFARGLTATDAGVATMSDASDHKPLWVEFALP